MALGIKLISDDELSAWRTATYSAKSLVGGESEAVTAAADAIERRLELLGVVALEDSARVYVFCTF